MSSENELSDSVASFITYIWQELIGNVEELFEDWFKLTIEQVSNILEFNRNNLFSKIQIIISLKIERSECILQERKKAINNNVNNESLLTKNSHDYYKSLNFKKNANQAPILDKRTLSSQFYLCQLLKDMISISEETNWSPRPSVQSKYRSIGAYVNHLSKTSQDFQELRSKITENSTNQINVLNIFEVIRPNESFHYKSDSLSNQKRLFHGSRVENFVGILTRGLLLPQCVENEHGIERTDVLGRLGCGIYFSNSIETSLKYSKLGKTRNTRLIGIYDVALGECKEYTDFDTSLTQPPFGYQSTHGQVSSGSKFLDSEYVVYDVTQCCLRYVVEVRDLKLDGPQLGEVVLKCMEKKEDEEKVKMEIEEDMIKMEKEEFNEGSIKFLKFYCYIQNGLFRLDK